MAMIYELDPKRMKSKRKMHQYMDELFSFADPLDAVNLDALNDSLSEVCEEIELVVTAASLNAICADDFAYTLLLVLTRAAEENPHIHVRFRKEEKG